VVTFAGLPANSLSYPAGAPTSATIPPLMNSFCQTGFVDGEAILLAAFFCATMSKPSRAERGVSRARPTCTFNENGDSEGRKE
jgi:hypothetical protein